MLAGLALYLQLAFASWGALATQAEPVDALAEHALCLATQDGSSQPARPADQAPRPPAHHHAASCCLWHQFPGLEPVATPTPQAVPHVKVTRLVHEYGARHKQLHFTDRFQQKRTVPVEWT